MKFFLPGSYKRLNRLILLLLLFGYSTVFSQLPATNILKDTAAILISSRFTFTEGPSADKMGNIFFTDQPNNKIWKYDTQGNLSVFLEAAGRSNGTYFDSRGNLVTCADAQNQLWLISPEGKVTIILKDFKGHTFNGPNDLWIDHKDGIYFTDPYFQRDYWTRKGPDPGISGERLYYLPKGKTEAIVVDANLKKPNGIVGINDEYLFVSDMGAGTIFKYTIDRDGLLKDRSVFIKDLADGITIDDQGDLYLAGNGITVYNSDGKKIHHVDIPSKWTANVCFGGKDNDILFITASESIYLLHMNVKGIK